MAGKLESFLAQRSDPLSRNALHVSSVFSKDFAQIAVDIRAGRLDAAREALESVKNSSLVQTVSASISAASAKVADFLTNLKVYGGPLAEIVLGCSMAVGGALLLTSGAGPALLLGLTVVALITVGVLIAMVGVDDWRAASESHSMRSIRQQARQSELR